MFKKAAGWNPLARNASGDDDAAATGTARTTSDDAENDAGASSTERTPPQREQSADSTRITTDSSAVAAAAAGPKDKSKKPGNDAPSGRGMCFSARRLCLVGTVGIAILALVIGCSIYFAPSGDGGSSSSGMSIKSGFQPPEAKPGARNESFIEEAAANHNVNVTYVDGTMEGSTGGSSNNSDTDVDADRQRRMDVLALLETSVDDPIGLQTMHSPQQAAMEWMLDHDPLQLPASDRGRFLQRYALVVLYYSMVGAPPYDAEGIIVAAESGEGEPGIPNANANRSETENLTVVVQPMPPPALKRTTGTTLDHMLTGEHECDWGKGVGIGTRGAIISCTTEILSDGLLSNPTDLGRPDPQAEKQDPGIHVNDGLRRRRSHSNLRRRLQDADDERSDVEDPPKKQGNGAASKAVQKVVDEISLVNLADELRNSALEADYDYNATMPADLHLLPYLQSLQLVNLGLVGNLQARSLGRLTKLRLLQLDNNRLQGQLDENLQNLTALQMFDVSNNTIQGSIPAYIGDRWTELRSINLDHNNMTGPIPDLFGKLEALKEVILDHNNFSGPIPPSLCRLWGPEDAAYASSTLSNVTCACCGQSFDGQGPEVLPLSPETGKNQDQTETEEAGEEQEQEQDPFSNSVVVPVDLKPFTSVEDIMPTTPELQPSFGKQVILSEDGSRLAVLVGDSTVRVYQRSTEGQTWERLGSTDIRPVPEGGADDAMAAMAFSGDGNVVAISHHSSAAIDGRVWVYAWQASDKAFEITGDGVILGGKSFGAALALNRNGDTVSIGIPGTTNKGTVVSYKLSDDGTVWRSKGQQLSHPTDAPSFGSAIVLSPMGNTLAVSAPLEGTGSIAIFYYNDVVWTPMGPVLPGANAGFQYGYSMAMSGQDDETAPRFIAVGAPSIKSLLELKESGAAEVAEALVSAEKQDVPTTEKANTLEENGRDRSGTVTLLRLNDALKHYVEDTVVLSSFKDGDECGRSVAISADGSFVAAGAPGSHRGTVYMKSIPQNITFSTSGSLVYSSPKALDYFGTSVSLGGGVMAVGSPVPSMELAQNRDAILGAAVYSGRPSKQ